MTSRVLSATVVLLAAWVGPCRAEGIGSIRATASKLVFAMDAGSSGRMAIVEAPAYGPAPGKEGSVVWEGRPQASVTVERFDGPRDRLFSRFAQVSMPSRKQMGNVRWVTQLPVAPGADFRFPWPPGKKGLTCPVDIDDVVALGTRYVNDNVSLWQALDLNSENPKEIYEIEGEKVSINTAYFHALDERFRRMTDAGINITVVINNPVPTKPDPRNPFIHPATDLAGAPNHLGAYNLSDARSCFAYRAVMGYFARRYSRPDKRYGWVTGYIVGNEIQAHWEWYNMGRVAPDRFLEEYATALRVTDLSVRSTHPDLRVYVSMDHHWGVWGPHDDDHLGLRGDVILDRLADISRAGGDFPWNVAFHPYPEDLFEPRFWRDKSALLRFDTPKVTFRNLEVLPAFLARPAMLYSGQPRRIILSEQGFHAPEGEEGERAQAAAYAVAYRKVLAMPTIDAFMLHRHVSHRGEGGLRLGLWTTDPNDREGYRPGRKLPIYDVFKAADTPGWRDAFAFALPIAALTSWDDVRPAARILPAAPPWREDAALIADLVALAPSATRSDCLDWRTSSAMIGTQSHRTIFHHPKDTGIARGTFTIDLPKVVGSRRIRFRCWTGFTGATSNGARFSLDVDGEQVWASEQVQRDFVSRDVDLTRFAGRRVQVSLGVDALGKASNDWANWARPRLVVTPPAVATRPRC